MMCVMNTLVLAVVLTWNQVYSTTLENTRLKGHVFVTTENSALYACEAACFRVPSCLSINFVKPTLECQFNSVNSSVNFTNFELVQKTIFVDRNDLAEHFSNGSCSDPHLYRGCEVDVSEETFSYGCSLPRIQLGQVIIRGNTLWWPGGSKLPLQCHDCAVPVNGSEISCLGENQWSTEGCKPPGTCAELQTCSRNYVDGDYWLYPSSLHGKKVKIYCSLLNTTKPREYISLPMTNIGIFPNKSNQHCDVELNRTCSDSAIPGTTIFQKIRVNISTFVVDREDYSFTVVKGKEIPYADARDCYTIHYNYKPFCGGPRGTFTIDLLGTGFVVSGNTIWKTYGWNTYMIVKLSPDRSRVDLRCGGWSGGCQPEADFILDFRGNQDVPVDSATEPSPMYI